jgi:hypothetical protein
MRLPLDDANLPSGSCESAWRIMRQHERRCGEPRVGNGRATGKIPPSAITNLIESRGIIRLASPRWARRGSAPRLNRRSSKMTGLPHPRHGRGKVNGERRCQRRLLAGCVVDDDATINTIASAPPEVHDLSAASMARCSRIVDCDKQRNTTEQPLGRRRDHGGDRDASHQVHGGPTNGGTKDAAT